MVIVAVAAMIAIGWKSFGSRGDAARREKMRHSPEWQAGHFENPQPLTNSFIQVIGAMFRASRFTAPATPLPVVATDPQSFNLAPHSGLRVTWFGHSATLVEIDGFRVLTDPALSERASPFSFVGPKRWYPPPLPIAQMPAIDAVVISHDHYDHMDMHSIIALNARGVTFVVPLGLGANLSYWGVPENRIVELDWWQEKQFENGGKKLRIAMTPARHISGRYMFDNKKKLWAGYALIGAKNRVYFSGDTGLFSAMKDIGNKYGPFDLTMIEVGQYNQAWPDWHIGPEQAVKAHRWVKGRAMLPIHWGLFVLAMHSWTEPVERAAREAAQRGVPLITPRPGESFEPIDFARERHGGLVSAKWWPTIEWQTAAEHSIVSTQVDETIVTPQSGK